MLNLHPDDVLFFHEVSAAMRRVAKQYDLPLRSITPLAMPLSGMADRLGDCASSGDIRLVMRATVDGQFCDAPRTPADVWGTAAHELAHLRHMNHGLAFGELHAELMIALDNQQTDHKEKMIAKLVKMQASRDGEASLGNTAAAEAFASAINRMLVEYELNPSDLDYARATDKDPVIELRADYTKYQIESKRVRIAWQESLARVVAKSHFCTFLLRTGSNQIWFVGTTSHATVAEYVFGTLVPAAATMASDAYIQYRKDTPPLPGTQKRPGTYGFVEAWLSAFVERINERFTEARLAAVAAAVADAPGSESQALVRLNGALAKVNKYIDDKFSGRKSSASALSGGRSTNSEGHARGRAAADKMVIGRRGVTGSSARGLLGK